MFFFDSSSMSPHLILLVVLTTTISYAQGGFNRCFTCRSRGDMGSCKDPFTFTNASSLPEDHGVQSVPCTSGWCGKILDRGANSYKDEEYGAATERLCLPRAPSDNEERCAKTLWKSSASKVFMCFCQGDLCNNSNSLRPSFIFVLPLILSLALYF